jgi:2-oxoglutarate/2-oxoacid ferredoxin oxidoreductase subunit beta
MTKKLKILQGVKELNTAAKCNWCPGCGDYGILMALKQAIFELKLDPEETILVSGIGCGSQAPHLVKIYGFHSLHGRAVPVATAMKMANHKMNVIIMGGDGDGYGIGVAHLINAARRNFNVTYIVQNNQVYGLTKGQTSPTSAKGFRTKSTPDGAIEPEMKPLGLALASGATFLARGYAGDIAHLKEIIKAGIQHRGFALIDTLQPCVTFNKVNTYQWFQERIYKLDAAGDASDADGSLAAHDPANRAAAFALCDVWGSKIPLGIYYREERATYEDELPVIEKMPLVKQDISNIDISPILEDYL